MTIHSARWFFGAMFICAGALAAPVQTASAEQKRGAQKVFEAADELYERGRYEEAAQAFKASYDLVPSPNSRLMWARALRELKRFDEARLQYEGTIADAEASGGRYPETYKAAQVELEALMQQLAFVSVNCSQENIPKEIRVDGRAVAWSPGERLVVPVPEADLVLLFPNGTTRHEHVQVAPGETLSLDLAPATVTEPRSESKPAVRREVVLLPQTRTRHGSTNALRTAAYGAGAVGTVGLGTFVVFGLLNRSTYASLQSGCNNGSCSIAQQHDIDNGRRYQTIANIGLSVAGLGAAAAVTLFVLSGRSSSHEGATALMIGPGRVALDGRF